MRKEYDLSQMTPLPKERRPKMALDALEPHNIKVRISIMLDADVLEYFKKQAAEPGALPYQTRINAVLRDRMDRETGTDEASRLVNDPAFIDAVAAAVRKLERESQRP